MPAIDWRAKSLLRVSCLVVTVVLSSASPALAFDDDQTITGGAPQSAEVADGSPNPASPCTSEPVTAVAVEPDAPELILVAGRCIPVGELNRLLDGYESAVGEETVALVELRDRLDAARDLRIAKEATWLSLAQVAQRLAAANAEVIRADDREQLALDELVAVTDQLAREEEKLRDQAVSAYITGNSARAAVQDRKLDPATTNEIATIRTYGSVLVETQSDEVDLVTRLQMAAAGLEAELQVARNRAAVARSALVEISETAEQIGDELVRLTDAADAATAEQTQLLVSIQMRRDEFAAQLGMVPPASGRLAAVLGGSGVAVAAADLTTHLSSPLEGTDVASVFGPRLHPIFNEVRPHTGVDLRAGAGSPILAAAAGEVVVAGDEGGYGRTIAIDHGGGVVTLYAHQSATAVLVGDRVEAGDLIGYVGSTGHSTGPHLHFELRIDGRPQDPLPFVDLSAGVAPRAEADNG